MNTIGDTITTARKFMEHVLWNQNQPLFKSPNRKPFSIRDHTLIALAAHNGTWLVRKMLIPISSENAN